jgi:hypothetical protein
MRVISYESARVTLLFPFEEVAPLGGADGKAIIAAVGDRYSFSRLPDVSASREDIGKNGIRFENGHFKIENHPPNILTLAVHNDGMNIDAAVSDTAEAFLEDLVRFLRVTFGFREFTSRLRKYFWSQLVVEFDRDVARLINGYEKIAESIRNKVAKNYSENFPICQFGRLDFRWDPSNPAISEPTPRFVFERRMGVPFERERYFCAASMRTSDHQEILEMLEGLASKSG